MTKTRAYTVTQLVYFCPQCYILVVFLLASRAPSARVRQSIYTRGARAGGTAARVSVMAASSPDAKQTQALDALFGIDADETWGTSIRLRTRCALARDRRGVLKDNVALHTAVEEDIKALPPGMTALPLAQVRQLVVHAFSFRNPRTLHTFLQMSPSARIENATELHEYIRRDGLCDPRFTVGALCLMLEALRREYAASLPAEA